MLAVPDCFQARLIINCSTVGVVHILRLHFKVGGWSIMLENCKLSTIKMQTFRWVGGQKSGKIANFVVLNSKLLGGWVDKNLENLQT